MSVSGGGRTELSVAPPQTPGRPRPIDDESLVDVSELVRAVIRARWLVVGIIATSMLVGLLVTALQDREYESVATIYVNPRKASVPMGLELGRVAALAGIGEAGIVTETALLESRAVAEAVVDSLSLHVSLEEPAGSYVQFIRALRAPRDAMPGRFEFVRGSDGSYSVEPQEPFPGTVPSSVQPGTPFRLGNVELVLLAQVDGPYAPKIVLAIEPFDAAVRRVRRDLTVEQYARGAQVISVRARHRDPVRAAQIPNVASNRFIQYRTELTKSEARNAVAFLRDQVGSYTLRLREAEDRLREFREQGRVLSPSEEASQQVRHLADLQARRNMLVAERDAIGTAISRAEAGSVTERSSPYRELASFPVFLSNAAVQSILRTLTELENELSDLLTRRTPENADVQQLVQRIGELERQLYFTARSYYNGLDNQIESLDASANRFSSGLENVPQQQVAYARLLREQQLLEEVYTLLQTRLKEAEIREVEDLSDVRIIDSALVPERPVTPRPALNLLLALFVGMTLGVGAAMTRAVVDPRVRTRDDAVLATAGVPVLGMIPQVGRRLPNGTSMPRSQRLGRLLAPISHGGKSDAALVVCNDRDSAASEAYRALRTNLTFGVADRAPQVMTVCSIEEGDGKSTIAANLALSMTQQGLRVLLLDCDLRRPRLHTVFSRARAPGVADLLAGRCDLDEAVRPVQEESLDLPLGLVTAGAPVSNAAELIGSPSMRKLLADLRERYDVVILDAPPLAAASEAAVLGVLADATLLVARATSTHKRVLAEAVAHLRQLSIPLAGIVINDAEPRDISYRAYRNVVANSAH